MGIKLGTWPLAFIDLGITEKLIDKYAPELSKYSFLYNPAYKEPSLYKGPSLQDSGWRPPTD